MELKEWYSSTQVAKLLRVSRVTILRFEKRGTLVPTKYVKRGKVSDRRYSRATIAEYLGITLDF